MSGNSSSSAERCVHQAPAGNGRLRAGCRRCRSAMAQRPVRTRILHADARPDVRWPVARAAAESSLASHRRRSSLIRSRPPRLRSMSRAWQARAGPAPRRASTPAADPRRARMTLRPSDRFDGPDEHGGGVAVGAADDVQAVVQAVDEVDIGMARRPEHHRRAAECGRRERDWLDRPGRRRPRSRRYAPTRRPAPSSRTRSVPSNVRAIATAGPETAACDSRLKVRDVLIVGSCSEVHPRGSRSRSSEDLAHVGWQDRTQHGPDEGHEIVVDRRSRCWSSTDPGTGSPSTRDRRPSRHQRHRGRSRWPARSSGRRCPARRRTPRRAHRPQSSSTW